jgi:ATP-dependent helicase/nuclease subunit A
MLRALKLRKIPVAGADRLKLQEEIAIRDFLVIAEAVLLESDDLALATALKSPIFGVSDVMLERLARGRSGSLREALRAMRDDSTLQRISARLDDLGIAARAASPFAFFSSLLIEPAPGAPAMSGRQAILTRLGLDAADPLDAFLSEAQEFSRHEPGSVLLFVLAQRERETEIKRDLEQGGNRVRIMTVHGAKGLEGRIVFLGDTVGKPESSKDQPAFLMPDARAASLLVWAGSKADEPEQMREVRRTERRKLLAEYRRLLYVGMTRAADRLYVSGYKGALTKDEVKNGEENGPPDDPMEWSWYQLMQAGISTMPGMIDIADNAAPPDAPRRIRRLVSAVPPATPAAIDKGHSESDTPLPIWLGQPVPAPSDPLPPLRPSKGLPLTEPQDGAFAGLEAFARRRGIVLHRLYEWLPDVAPAMRQPAGRALLQRFAPELQADEVEALLAPVLAVLASPEGHAIFGTASRAEVAISGRITLPDGTPRDVSARIDRLVIHEDRADIIDLKTGRPHLAAGDSAILRQMALYRAVLAAIYPGKTIACAVLWTETGQLDPLPSAALDSAFLAITTE